MRGNINPQQVTKLLKKQQHNQRQKEKSISLKFDPIIPISPK
jgi:hypothetical protein